MAKKDINQVAYDSKAEKARAEREARIKAMRDKDGIKKSLKVKDHKTRNRVLSSVGAGVLVLAFVLYLLWTFGVPQRSLNAAQINQQEIKVVEYNYSYFSTANMYTQYFGNGGLLDLKDSSKDITGQDLTWGQFFTDTAKNSLQQENILYQKAVEAGYTLSEEDQANIDDYLEQMQTSVGTPVDFELYLTSAFGKGMTVDSLRAILEKQTLAGKFDSEAASKYEISAEDVKKNYDENPDSYDLVNYHSFTLVTPTQKDDGTAMTTEEIAAAKASNEELAKKIVSELSKPEDVRQAAIDNAAKKDQLQYEGEKDITLLTNRTKRSVSGSELQTWLFDKERKTGEKSHFASGNDFVIVYFLERFQDTRPTADLILSSFDLEDSTGEIKSDEDLAKIRTAATDLAASIKTEQDVLDYDAKDPDASVPKASPSRKIEKLDGSNAASINSELLEWVLSEEAKIGTTKTIETADTLYVILILDRPDVQSWYAQNELLLQSQAYSNDFKSWIDDPVNALEMTAPGSWLVE